MKSVGSAAISLSISLVVLVSASSVIFTSLSSRVEADENDKKKAPASIFRQSDADGDAKLTLQEFTQATIARVAGKSRDRLTQTAKERFQKIDTDGDGFTDGKAKLSLEQYTEAVMARANERAVAKASNIAKQRFEKLDTNGDQFLDVEELNAVRKDKKS